MSGVTGMLPASALQPRFTIMARYNVVVGNIGLVTETDDMAQAQREFATYRSMILDGIGRAEGSVLIFDTETGEIIVEWDQDDYSTMGWTAIWAGEITVKDPETGADIEMEVWKCRLTGGMVAIDASYLDQVREKVANPYLPGSTLKLKEEDMPHARTPRTHPPETRRPRRVRCDPGRSGLGEGDPPSESPEPGLDPG